MQSGSLARKFSAIFAGNIVSFTISILFPIILVRIFTTEEYGSYYQMIACAGIFELGFTLGLRPSLLYFASKEPENHTQYMLNTLVSNLVTGVVVFGIAVLLRDWIADWLQISELRYLIPMMAGYATFEIFSSVLTAHFMVQERAKEVAYVTTLYAFSRAVVLILVASMTRSPSQTLIALTLWAFAKYLITHWIIFHGRWAAMPRMLMTLWPTMKQQLLYGLPLGISNFFQKGVVTFDRALVSSMFGASAVAIYQVGFFRIPLVAMFYNSMAEVIVPRLTQDIDANRLGEAHRIWISAIEKSALLFFPVSFYFIFMANEFTRALFTEAYMASVPIFRACMVLSIVQAIAYGTVIRACGKTSLFLRFNIISLLIFAGSIYPLAKMMGILGIALSVVLSQSVYAFIMVFSSLKILERNVRSFPWLRLLAILLIGAVVTYGVTEGVRMLPWENDWVRLFVATVAIPIAIAITLLLKIVKLPFRELLRIRGGGV